MRRFVAVLLLGLGLGCASLDPSKVMQSWVGSHYSDLTIKWGPPTRIRPDGQGGQILIYEYDRYDGETGSVSTRTFWVDSAGRIYNGRWQGW